MSWLVASRRNAYAARRGRVSLRREPQTALPARPRIALRKPEHPLPGFFTEVRRMLMEVRLLRRPKGVAVTRDGPPNSTHEPLIAPHRVGVLLAMPRSSNRLDVTGSATRRQCAATPVRTPWRFKSSHPQSRSQRSLGTHREQRAGRGCLRSETAGRPTLARVSSSLPARVVTRRGALSSSLALS